MPREIEEKPPSKVYIETNMLDSELRRLGVVRRHYQEIDSTQPAIQTVAEAISPTNVNVHATFGFLLYPLKALIRECSVFLTLQCFLSYKLCRSFRSKAHLSG